MKNPSVHCIPLHLLSNEAAFEILNFLGATFQIFETHYASQIHRYYETIIVDRTQSPAPVFGEPF